MKDPTTFTLFKRAPLGAGAGANPSDGDNAIGGEGGGALVLEEGVTTDNCGDGDGVRSIMAVAGAEAGDLVAIADPMNSANDNIVRLMMEAIVE